MFRDFVNSETGLINQWMESSNNYELLYGQLLTIIEENIQLFGPDQLRVEVNQQFQDVIRVWIDAQVEDFAVVYNPMLIDILRLSLDNIDYWEIAEHWIDTILI